tara:strand:- start:45 stop:344 length:300 start_codon:yes stop_codon:yes gene_type:complete
MAKKRPGLYANIQAKRRRIKAGSGEKMRKPGSEGAPTAQNFKDAAKTAKKSHGGELHGGQKKLDKNKNGRIDGQDFKMMHKGGDVIAGNANRRRSQNHG